MLSKIKNSFQNSKVVSVFLSLTTLFSVFCMTYLDTFAANVKASDLMGTILGYVCKIAMYVGILLLAWGLIQLFMAFKNEDADSKQRAIMVIIASICLISVQPIVTAITGKAGVSVKNVKDF